MSNKRLYLLSALAIGLATLLWLDRDAAQTFSKEWFFAEEKQNQTQTREKSENVRRSRKDTPSQSNSREDDKRNVGTDEKLDALETEQPESALNPLAAFDRDILEETTERPLFAPSRSGEPAFQAPAKPRPVVKKTAPKITARPLTYSVVGVMMDNFTAIALLKNKSNGRTVRVEKGDVVDGWRIEKIETKSVTFAKDSEKKILPLAKKQ